MVDLHTHSRFSDGTLTPEALAAACAELRLSAAVLTDHDTADGYARFEAAAASHGIRTLTGMEISADVPGHTVHLLAYGFDPANGPLREALDKVRKGRETRQAEILSKLAMNGCRITPEDVRREGGDTGVPGRPHIAAALVRKGFARDRQDAFRRFLARGALAYAERFRLSLEAYIRLVRGAGGVVVLAHPFQTLFTNEELRGFVKDLTGYGLTGVEVYYPGHDAPRRDFLHQLSRENHLIETGGSDFHGDNKPGLSVGTGYNGTLHVPDACFENLAAACAAARNATEGT